MNDWLIAPEARTLRGQVLQKVRSAVASGAMAPGSRVNEVAVAAELGVSRGTLREALRRLEQEGLLVTHPHRGTFVRRLSADEIVQVYAVRFALECCAAETAASRLTPSLRADLRQRVTALEEMREAGDFAGAIEADLRFHEALCETSGNTFLVEQWRSLVGLVAAVMHTAGREFVEPLQSPEEHWELLAAVESGESTQIRSIWRAHFDKGAATLGDAVRRRDQDDNGATRVAAA